MLFRDRIGEIRCRNTSQGSLCATLPSSSPTRPAVLPCPHCCGAPGPTPACRGAPPPCLHSPLKLPHFTLDLLLWAEPLAHPLLHQHRVHRDCRGDHSCSPCVQSYLIFSFPVKQFRLHTVSCNSHRPNYQRKSHYPPTTAPKCSSLPLCRHRDCSLTYPSTRFCTRAAWTGSPDSTTQNRHEGLWTAAPFHCH